MPGVGGGGRGGGGRGGGGAGGGGNGGGGDGGGGRGGGGDGGTTGGASDAAGRSAVAAAAAELPPASKFELQLSGEWNRRVLGGGAPIERAASPSRLAVGEQGPLSGYM